MVVEYMAMVSRRTVLKMLAAAAGAAVAERFVGPTGAPAKALSVVYTQDAHLALGLRIATPEPGAAPEFDLRRDFGAAGDAVQDDAPAFFALADAVNAGRVPAGSVVFIPPGRYRVVGNRTITFRQPVVLRGPGVGVTTIQPEYTAQRSVFHRATGEGMYVRHSMGTCARMEIGGGGNQVHTHDGPYNELVENYARVMRVLNQHDGENRLVANWHVAPTNRSWDPYCPGGEPASARGLGRVPGRGVLRPRPRPNGGEGEAHLK